MPLDGHSYLVNQGWGGKGTGLRQGAISRPLAIPQKKNLAGLGKDRDEAFPFWDHLFTAAAKSIQVKCLSDGEGDGTEGTDASSSNNVTIKRTSTGIFSTRRPVEGTPVTSGSTTPNTDSGSQTPRLSLLATAKRDAAKHGLYSRFFRGPVLGPETLAEERKHLASLISEVLAEKDSGVESVTVTEHVEIQTADKCVTIDLEVSKASPRKRKAKDQDEATEHDEEAKRERKKRKKEEKKRNLEGEVAAKAERDRKEKKKKKKRDRLEAAVTLAHPSGEDARSTKHAKKHKEHGEDAEAGVLASLEETASERKRRKEKRKRLKEEKKRAKALVWKSQDATLVEEVEEGTHHSRHRKEKSSSRTKSNPTFGALVVEGGKKKKRRKHADLEESG